MLVAPKGNNMNRLVAASLLAFSVVSLASAQMPDAPQYLDIYVAKVKPERRADFDAICRKIANANRSAKGDTWLARQVEYGENNTVYFVSQRQDLGAIDQGSAAFINAMRQAYGAEAWKKMEQDLNATLVSSRAEIRRRRMDLSISAPQDPQSFAKLMGAARWVRETEIRIRPGHEAQFEEEVKAVKAAFEKNNTSWPILISQLAAGQPGVIYYLTVLQPSLAGYDSAPKLKDILGDEGMAALAKSSAEDILSEETTYMRYLPELSNPPEEIAQTAMDFWRPKAAGVAMAQPKPKPPVRAATAQ
jgi:quinol monooxygenase YgiN